MNTMIRVGVRPFYAEHTFPYGLSRSGYFSKREAEELSIYGHSLQGLLDNSLVPLNEEESTFTREIASGNCQLHLSKLWKKYMLAISHSKMQYGFIQKKLITE